MAKNNTFRQSNLYIVLYVLVLVVLVGTALAYTAMALRPRQQLNEDADKMRQILASVHVTASGTDIAAEFGKYIVGQYIASADGTSEPGDAFAVNVADEVRKPADSRELPVFECQLPEGRKYIVPVYGAGLWGPIWGYVSVDADGSTIYGAYFAHQGETPGLGAEIEKPAFSSQFDNKQLFKDGRFLPVAVVKKGQRPANGEDYVDGVSGGTITSKGVSSMLSDCMAPYEKYFQTLRNK